MTADLTNQEPLFLPAVQRKRYSSERTKCASLFTIQPVSFPKNVNLGRFSLLLRRGLRNQRFELSHPPTHIITENLILSQNQMRFCISITKLNTFFPSFFNFFYRKIKYVFAFLSKNLMRF